MNPVRIQRLSSLVSNQIAAGEVIERPASVVKELLENALDAGANAISVEIGFGGLNQVKVSDNGTGIVADDLPLAVALHATSKISELNDLYAIRSMGFRGEALASIASVSRLSVSSKPEHQAHAMMLHTEGEAVHCTPCARSRGTTIDVRDLFYNAPVRKKFLKSEQREFQAIEAVVKRFALSAPAVALTLAHNDKPIFVLPAARCEKTTWLRIRKLLGKAFTDDAIHLDIERAGMRLQGWISGPDYQRSQQDKQWIYINQRMVKDKLLNHAMKQAYDGVLHPGRHPACVLYLTVPPSDVDVNVHPTKHEVRFQQPRLVHDLMRSQIACAVASCKLEDIEPLEIRESHPVYTSSVNTFSRLREKVPAGRMRAPSDSTYYPEKPSSVASRHLLSQAGEGSPWLVLNNAFAVVTIDRQPYLLDIERLQQHHLSTQLSAQTYPLASRPLLLPVRYATETLTHASLECALPVLIQLGIQANFVSESCLLVRTIPQLFPTLEILKFLEQLHLVPPTLPALLDVFIACQSFDANQLNNDEKRALLGYLLADLAILKHFSRPLDAATCRGFLHD